MKIYNMKLNVNLMITTVVASLVILFSGVGHLYAALPANPTAPVLGEAGRFAILASQKVTTSPVSSVSDGDIGIIDIARTGITGFTPTGPAGDFTTLTNGTSYAPDDANPAPFPYPLHFATLPVGAAWTTTGAMITQVRTDLGNAYTFLAADPNPNAPTTVLADPELGGKILTRGVYKTGVDLLVSTPLHLDAQGDPTSVFIFSTDGNLTTGDTGNIFLDNGALPQNVYWRTAGITTIAAGTTFYGNVFSYAQVNVLDGANVTGRLFSTNEQVTLISNTVTAPPALAPCTGTVGTSVFVSTSGSDSNNDGSVDCPFATIQAAVNAGTTADGDTINVAEGTYIEQLTINKNLTVIGAGEDKTTIQSPDTLTSKFTKSGNPMKPVVTIIGATANISALKVDGAGKGDSVNNTFFVGIGFYNAGGSLDHVTVTGVKETPTSRDYQGDAVRATDDNGSLHTLSITNSTISDFQKNGITLSGSGLTVTVSGNHVTGSGVIDLVAQNGIVLGAGVTGSVTGNTVGEVMCNDSTCSNNWYADYQATAISLAGAIGPITVSGNTVSNSDIGIYSELTSGGSTITDNILTGNRWFGMLFEQGDVAVSGGSVTGGEIGIFNPLEHNSGSTTVHSVNISANSIAGLKNDAASFSVDAANNWWGNASGPNDPTLADGSTPEINAGSGSMAIGAVNYSDWCVNATCTIFSTAKPVITLKGVTPNIGLGSTYTELEATAVDSIGNPVTVIISGSVNTAVVGSYTITYTATDTFGNTATATRTVNVVRTNNGEGGGGGGGSVGVGVYHPAIPATPAVPGVSPAVPATPAVPANRGEVLGASAFSFNNGLALGSRNNDVTELQNRLTAEGVYFGPITGYFGSLTAQGVKNFQKKYGISQVGSVGPQTRAQLNSGMANAILGCLAGNNYSITTGQSCLVQTSSIPGCLAGNNFSITTGQSCLVQTSSIPGCYAGNDHSITTGQACYTH